MNNSQVNIDDVNGKVGKPHPTHPVAVKINNKEIMLETGDYLVTDLKIALSVPAEYELEHVVNGIFSPLADHSVFPLRHAEEFISHVRTGSSS